jgi:hypothetical protein
MCVCMCVCMYVVVCVCVCVCIYVCLYLLYIYVRMFVFIYSENVRIYVCISLYMYVCRLLRENTRSLFMWHVPKRHLPVLYSLHSYVCSYLGTAGRMWRTVAMCSRTSVYI